VGDRKVSTLERTEAARVSGRRGRERLKLNKEEGERFVIGDSACSGKFYHTIGNINMQLQR
jgi:hypothetical protein